ncbi:hypothetical protein MSHOH_3475 [Methanosarcina horonobensis HB-1 = JCM 15518]|uniref:Ferric oxidoreductase domain-containing protein n=1 Tax=Methanosarcina horonobensis HB-1 = JCM 15518 TaxID=1434110 RepID=A0A0E3SIS4_9EURY|nr:ferric reductase-like transmembrane domain-containing protein [Methanosarcina horonobensis]AKB79958.1 hypothetical protein MSHOH_3475 [Methanosarcina horonobensis HB-1 = JCM 15518]
MSKDADGKEKGHKSDKGMSDKKISNKKFYLIYGIILVIVLFIAYLLLQRPGEPLRMVARFAATFGYLTIFLSILSSEYMAKMRKISGLPFLKAHHHLARIGILLILIHPLALAIGGQGFRIFLPEFYPVNRFLMFGGKTAIYLFLLAAGIALYRKKYRNWKKVHYLSYLAFLLVSAHALLIGSDFKLEIMRILTLVMAATVTGIFIHKRLGAKTKTRKNRNS